jgi:hypothetical protein
MSDASAPATGSTITIRVPLEEKALFSELAGKHGVSLTTGSRKISRASAARRTACGPTRADHRIPPPEIARSRLSALTRRYRPGAPVESSAWAPEPLRPVATP